MHFVERKSLYFILSGLLIVPGLVFLALGGLKPGIEFKGGTLLDIRFDSPPAVSEVHEVMGGLGHDEAIVQVAEGGRVEVRTFAMSPDELTTTQQTLQQRYGATLKDVSSSVVSPSFSGELIENAVKSIALASVLIVLLIAFAFRSFGWAAFRYGIAAIIALLHDAAFVLGLFAILGYFFNV
ncbi:MAG: hypothetical protein AAB295_12725, partial [Chloroflexota bacterium]